MRLHAFIARSGAASRRAAERMIAEGRVRVNGETVTEMGRSWNPGDRVELDGRALELETRKVHVLLYKPAGYLCSSSDPEGRKLALDLLREEFRERLYNVGRLDQWSSGLILFTNDGEFARAMSHPSSGIEKEYLVEAVDPLPEGFLESFEKGIRAGGETYRAVSARARGERGADIVLVEGKNREIRRVFEAAGIRIKALERVRIGHLGLGGLAPGAYRILDGDEVAGLMGLAGRRGGAGHDRSH